MIQQKAQRNSLLTWNYFGMNKVFFSNLHHKIIKIRILRVQSTHGSVALFFMSFISDQKDTACKIIDFAQLALL